MTALLEILADDSSRAAIRTGLEIAEAIRLLIKEGSELGALEYRTIVDSVGMPICDADGHPRRRAYFPQVWLRRLEDAAVRGAFDRYSVREIVDRILGTEPADAAPAELARLEA